MRGSGECHRIGWPSRVPGEDARRVGEHQALGPQVAADGEQAVVFGVLGRREGEPAVEPEHGHAAHQDAAGVRGVGRPRWERSDWAPPAAEAARLDVERQLLAVEADRHRAAVLEPAEQDLVGQRIAHLGLDHARQRPRAVDRVVALLARARRAPPGVRRDRDAPLA